MTQFTLTLFYMLPIHNVRYQTSKDDTGSGGGGGRGEGGGLTFQSLVSLKVFWVKHHYIQPLKVSLRVAREEI